MVLQEFLEEGEGEGGRLLPKEVVLRGHLQRRQRAGHVELFVVEGDEGFIDLTAATVGGALRGNGRNFLLALFLELHPAVSEDSVELLLADCKLLLDFPVGAD